VRDETVWGLNALTVLPARKSLRPLLLQVSGVELHAVPPSLIRAAFGFRVFNFFTVSALAAPAPSQERGSSQQPSECDGLV
jgi:hypothetical protein